MYKSVICKQWNQITVSILRYKQRDLSKNTCSANTKILYSINNINCSHAITRDFNDIHERL